jgi:hypothetical protein
MALQEDKKNIATKYAFTCRVDMQEKTDTFSFSYRVQDSNFSQSPKNRGGLLPFSQ